MPKIKMIAMKVCVMFEYFAFKDIRKLENQVNKILIEILVDTHLFLRCNSSTVCCILHWYEIFANLSNGNFLDTEEASETDMGKSEEYTEIKEQ